MKSYLGGFVKKGYVIEFLLYSMIGWIYEVLLEYFVFKHGFVNRGFLYGPYCPIYGIGALIFLIGLRSIYTRKICLKSEHVKVNITPIVMFLLIVLICSIVELFGSYIMEFVTGSWSWDYSDYFCNFEGRVALDTSFRFGVGGLFFVYCIHPLLRCVMKKFKEKDIVICSCLILWFLLIDLLFTLFG